MQARTMAAVLILPAPTWKAMYPMMSKSVACQGARRSMRRPDENADEAEKTDTETATLYETVGVHT
jgi:hypothetical protein